MPTKVCIGKAMIFPVVRYSCESWTVKEGRALKNWCLLTVVLEKMLERPLDNKKIKSILKEVNTRYSLKGLMLKLKLQYFVTWYEQLTHWKSPNAGKDWGQKERGQQIGITLLKLIKRNWSCDDGSWNPKIFRQQTGDPKDLMIKFQPEEKSHVPPQIIQITSYLLSRSSSA